jgi:hypothetical protein
VRHSPTRLPSAGRIRRLSPTLVIALVALFLSLTGTGLAGKSSRSTDPGPLVGISHTAVLKNVTIPPGGTYTVLTCPGKRWFPVSGIYSSVYGVSLMASFPFLTGWYFNFSNQGGSATISLGVECLKPRR